MSDSCDNRFVLTTSNTRLKLSAYAGLYTTLDAHKKILEGKNEGLQRVQDSLVKNSGSVVGGAMDEGSL